MDPRHVNDRLAAARADRAAFAAERPQKFDAEGRAVDARSAFAAEDRAGNRFVEQRDRVRRTFFTVVDGVVVSLEDVMPGKAPIEDHDRAENLCDSLTLRTLQAIEDAGLSAAELDETPWSDDYWAIYSGQLGKRYGDPEWPGSQDWEAFHDHVQGRPVAEIARSGDAAAIDRLSPAEKYDLLVGDSSFGLTRFMWDQGRGYHQRHGKVETWMGVCHGWAPAAYMLRRPRAAVRVTAPDGHTPITFYPADVKALASQLWANARTVTRFIGGRCNDKEPAVDAQGRVISSRCLDTNPGTWHLALVNQLGVNRRSFIIDATYDYEVWNQPMHGYSYTLFDPKSGRSVARAADAIVARADFPDDPYAAYRSPEAKYIAGVFCRARYVVETQPSQRADDDASRDAVHQVDYVYDLELDGDYRIIGGEWHQQAHPDFLWTPPPEARAITPADRLVGGLEWKGSVLPDGWRRAAPYASAKGLPMARVVEVLIDRANR